jgi:hypothetical protein
MNAKTPGPFHTDTDGNIRATAPNHTPGPWYLDGETDGDAYRGWICTASGPCGRMEPVCHLEACSPADAELIHAAPDLLQAGEALMIAIHSQQQWLAKQHPHVWARLMAATEVMGIALEKAGL